jgi:hypothetical protein
MSLSPRDPRLNRRSIEQLTEVLFNPEAFRADPAHLTSEGMEPLQMLQEVT